MEANFQMERKWKCSHFSCVMHLFALTWTIKVSKQLLQVSLIDKLHRGFVRMLLADSQEVVGFWIPTDPFLGSALKSGPVSVLLPFLEGPRTGPVPESFRMQEPWTRTAKNCKKPVETGCNWSRNEYNKKRAILVKK